MPSVQKQSQQSAAAAAEGTVVVGVVMLAVIGVVIGGRRHSRRSRGGGDTTINEGAVRDAGTCCGDGAEVAHAATTGRAAAVAAGDRAQKHRHTASLCSRSCGALRIY